MITQCEMVELNITNTKCSARTKNITDWCHVCRVREIQNNEE